MPLQLKLSKQNIIQPITQGTRLQVEAQVGETYALVDPITGKTPEDIVIRRLGDNLLIESPSQAGMVEIADFWKTCSPEHSCQVILDVPEQAGASKMILTQNNNPLPFLQAGQVGSLSAGQTLGQVSSEPAISIPVHYWNKIVLSGAGLTLGALVYGQEKNGDKSNPAEARTLQGTIALSDFRLLKGETAFVVISLNDPLALSTSYFMVENGTLSNLMALDNGRTWTATLTPTAELDDAENIIQLFNKPTSEASSQRLAVSSNYEIATNQPLPPVITLAPASDTGVLGDSGTNIPKPALMGTGEPGSTIFIRDGNKTSGDVNYTSAMVGNNGSWQLTLANPLLEGKQKVAGYLQDADGNKSDFSNVELTLDTTKPWVVFATMDNLFLAPNDSTTIKLYFIEPVLNFDLSDMRAENGTLSNLIPLSETPDGYHPYQMTFTAGTTTDFFNAFYLDPTYTDLFGNTPEHDQGWANYSIGGSGSGGGDGSGSLPTISIRLDAAYDTLNGDPSDNNQSPGATPAFRGTANPNAELIITVSGNDTIFHATASATGQWSLSTSPTTLLNGEYTVYVTYEVSPPGAISEIAAYRWEII